MKFAEEKDYLKKNKFKENLDNYIFRSGRYNCNFAGTVLYAIPNELYKED